MKKELCYKPFSVEISFSVHLYQRLECPINKEGENIWFTCTILSDAEAWTEPPAVTGINSGEAIVASDWKDVGKQWYLI